MTYHMEEKIRGNTIFNAKKTYNELYGDFNDLLDKMDESTREELSKPIMSSEWYGLQTYILFLKTLEKSIGKEGLKSINKKMAENQMKGLYALMTKFVSLKALQPHVDKMWKKQYNKGDLSAEIGSDNIKLKLEDFDTEDIHLYAISCWMSRFIELISKKKAKKYDYTRTGDTTIFKYVLE